MDEMDQRRTMLEWIPEASSAGHHPPRQWNGNQQNPHQRHQQHRPSHFASMMEPHGGQRQHPAVLPERAGFQPPGRVNQPVRGQGQAAYHQEVPRQQQHAPTSYNGGSGYRGHGYQQQQPNSQAWPTQDVVSFCQHWGLDESTADFLMAIPQALRESVLRNFDGSGTKDGNVWGRLFGYVRRGWVSTIGLEPSATKFIQDLPEPVQIICIKEFDHTSTKDGNVFGRLQAFSRKAAKIAEGNSGPMQSHQHHQATPPWATKMSAAPQQQHAVHWNHAAPAEMTSSVAYGDQASDLRPELEEFMFRCSLDEQALPWLQSLSEDILRTVIMEFDPSGTKDGNVLGRLQGYVRLLNAKSMRRREDEPGRGAKRMRY